MNTEPADSIAKIRRRIHWLRWILASLLLACVAGHKPLLRTCARLLIVEEQTKKVDWVQPSGGDRRFDIAAEWIRDGQAKRVLLFEDSLRNLTRYGILPPGHEIALKELDKRGVPQSMIDLRPRDQSLSRPPFADLVRCLTEDESARVGILVDRFSTRQLRLALDRALDVELARRVTVVALTDRRYDESNWWKSREGIKAVMNATLRLVHAWGFARSDEPVRRWDPEEYEVQLRKLTP